MTKYLEVLLTSPDKIRRAPSIWNCCSRQEKGKKFQTSRMFLLENLPAKDQHSCIIDHIENQSCSRITSVLEDPDFVFLLY